MSPVLTVGILTRGTVSTSWAIALRNLKLPESTVIHTVPGLPFDHARNQLVKRMLKDGSKHILFLDDDVLPPPNAYEKLSVVPSEVVSGLYFKRQGRITPTIYREAHPSPQPIVIERGGSPIMEVEYVGGGCLLVHRSVFERLKYPWFEWRVDREDLPLPERVGEDFSFCTKVRQSGLRIFAHLGVRCRHMGNGYSDEDGHFVPESPTEIV